MSNQHNKLWNMYPMFTNVPSFWISLVPSISQRPTGNCCTRPPNTCLRNSILLWYDWMIDPKTSYEIDAIGHPIVLVPIYTPFNLKFSLQPSHVEYFSWEYMPLKWLTLSSNIVLQVFPFSLSLYRNSFVHSDRVNVSKNSEMILRAAKWSLPILTFLQNHSAWFAKSDFIAYSHVFQVIIKLKYRFMKN